MTCITRVASQNARDKVLQLRSRHCLLKETSALHIKYHKLNIIGCDGINKETRTEFCMPQSKYLFVCATQGTRHVYSQVFTVSYCLLESTTIVHCLYTRVLLLCSKYLYVHFTAHA